MDLRNRLHTEQDLREIERLVGETHFIYQPFRFTDTLEVGIGYESILNKRGGGMVYWPDAPIDQYPLLERFLVPVEAKEAFSGANQRLREINDDYVDQVCRHYPVTGKSVADVGCFAGYFPIAFSLRGARAFGYDIHDRGGCFAVLNRILGADAMFIHSGYDLATGLIPQARQHDLVICHDLVQHMIEPFRFINMLANMSREALFLKCPTWLDTSGDRYITVGQPNGIFRYGFPWCFDHDNIVSYPLLQHCLELCGFTRFIKIETKGFPQPEPTERRAFATFSILALRSAPMVKSDFSSIHTPIAL